MNDKVKELLATQSYKGVPVITTVQLTEILAAGSSTVRSTLCVHKDKFKEGVHYYKLSRQELLAVKQEGVIPVNPAAINLTLLTEKGVKTYLHLKATSHQGKALPDKQQKVQQIPPQMAEKPVQQSLVTVSGTRCYVDENQIAWLNAEDVARGLGFVEAKKDRVATSGDNFSTVRWSRVNKYLHEFGFFQNVGKDDFIPENMFYRLAMKANNETAQVFQAKVADEILPTLRRTGYYGKQPTMSREEFKQLLKKINAAEEQKILAVQKVSNARKQLAAAENTLTTIETTIEDLYKTINVSLTEGQQQDVKQSLDIKQNLVTKIDQTSQDNQQPLLDEDCFTLGELHSLVEDKMSLSEFYQYCKNKDANLSGTFDRGRTKISAEDAATIMATLGITLENLTSTLQQQTLTLQQVVEKLQVLGYNQLNDQSLSVTNLINLLKEYNLPLSEQPHQKGARSKDSTVTKQTFFSLLSLLQKPS